MFYVKITSTRANTLDYSPFDTKTEAKKWLDDNGYVLDIISVNCPVKSLPDIYWNSELHCQAMIFESKNNK